MRIYFSLATVGLAAVIALAACNSNEHTPKISSSAPLPSPAAQNALPPGDSARRITPAEVKDEVAKNNAVILDVRGEAAYKQGHIKGSRLIPATEILAHVDELPRDKMIITYCS
jgi:3-mercaptopyruvate sulfurtransferase SseA